MSEVRIRGLVESLPQGLVAGLQRRTPAIGQRFRAVYLYVQDTGPQFCFPAALGSANIESQCLRRKYLQGILPVGVRE